MPPYMYMHGAHPLGGLLMMALIWIVQLIIAYLIMKDAKEQKMVAPVWVILAIIPMFGFFVDLVYLIIRELRPLHTAEKTTASL
jgi:hypothetical protein